MNKNLILGIVLLLSTIILSMAAMYSYMILNFVISSFIIMIFAMFFGYGSAINFIEVGKTLKT